MAYISIRGVFTDYQAPLARLVFSLSKIGRHHLEVAKALLSPPGNPALQ